MYLLSTPHAKEFKHMPDLSSPLPLLFSQEFLSDRELGQSKLNALIVSGEFVSSITSKDKVDAFRSKMNTAREDWKNIMSSLHNRETSLQVSIRFIHHLWRL